MEMDEKINKYIVAVNMSWEKDNDSERREILINMHKLYTNKDFKQYHSKIKERFRQPIQDAYKKYRKEMNE